MASLEKRPGLEIHVGRVGLIGEQAFDPEDQRFATHFTRGNVENVRTEERHVNVEIVDRFERVCLFVLLGIGATSMQMADAFRLSAIETEVTSEEHIAVFTFDPDHHGARTMARAKTRDENGFPHVWRVRGERVLQTFIL